MDVLRQAYPNVQEELLESTLVSVDLDVIDALELLRLSLGTPDDIENQSTVSSSNDHGFYETQPEVTKQNDGSVQAESSKDDVQSLQTQWKLTLGYAIANLGGNSCTISASYF